MDLTMEPKCPTCKGWGGGTDHETMEYITEDCPDCIPIESEPENPD